MLLKEKVFSVCSKYDIINTNCDSFIEQILISSEDHRYKYHIGFDIIAIIRAFRNRLIYNKYEGASTIEQQVVRVIINRFEKTPKRKIREIFLATTLCYIIPRKSIPLLYLHIAYYGTSLNSLEKILTKYQIENVSNLNLEKAADLVARIKYPEPKEFNKKRLSQIEMRKKHIVSLYKKHSKLKIFKVYY